MVPENLLWDISSLDELRLRDIQGDYNIQFEFQPYRYDKPGQVIELYKADICNVLEQCHKDHL